MSPQPPLSLDLQQYIGTNLISHHLRENKKGRKNEKIDFKNNCRTRRNSGGIIVPVCNCCGGVQIQKSSNFTEFQNYAWTGVPLISMAKGRPRQPQYSNNTRSQTWPNFSDYEYSKKSKVGGSVPPKYYGKAKYNIEVTENELSSMSKLALHTQGSPLVVSREDIITKEDPNLTTKTLKGRSLYVGSELYLHPQHLWIKNDAAALTRIGEACSDSIRFELRPTPVLDETDSVSGESDMKSEPDLNESSAFQQSDNVSITSDSSGSSDYSLPRIIKPRKRRKRDRKINEFKGQNIGVILTLKPYQPLCFPYADRLKKTKKISSCNSTSSSLVYSAGSEHRLESIFGSLTMTEPSLYPYPPSSLCSCRRCITQSTFLSSPLHSFENLNEITKESLQESVCEVSTRIVTSPCGSRDLEIKFITSDQKKDPGYQLKKEATTHSTPKSDASLPSRPWMTPYKAVTTDDVPKCSFTVMSYNILCPKYASQQIYSYCPPWALDWEYRRKAIMDDIRHFSADIITLQEVETGQFYGFFLPELRRDGYEGVFSPKSRAKIVFDNERKRVDGCAIFFRTNKFSLIKETLVEFNQVALATAEGSDDMLNRVQTKDNIGLVVLLQPKAGPISNCDTDHSHLHQPLLVCTTHMHWDPEYSDVKLIQTMMLMHELRRIAQDATLSNHNSEQASDVNTIPLLLCGDFNSLPTSGVVEFLTTGKVSADHSDFKGFGYKDCLQKLSTSRLLSEYSHPFRISPAYKYGDMHFTNFTNDFKGVIDYIFYPDQYMRIVGLLGPLDDQLLRENNVVGFPHPLIPSDHLPLLVELEMACSPKKFN
ncbi:uncharacterized protein LOC106457757 [Limulus polyphemus]|uniref:Uncharacterized protein LOC106457757 n=1 Tax=Limulus polyphemus TaxID=6850 RepID=A0ABM1B156_LIMPO|nr:uncharacterized protein LOC106457757 [Limulus polyphemus]